MSEYTLQEIRDGWFSKDTKVHMAIDAAIAREADLVRQLGELSEAQTTHKFECDELRAEIAACINNTQIWQAAAEKAEHRVRELEAIANANAAVAVQVSGAAGARGALELTDDQIANAAYRSGWDVRYEDYDGDETETPHMWNEDGDDDFPSLCNVVREALKAAAPVAENAAKDGAK